MPTTMQGWLPLSCAITCFAIFAILVYRLGGKNPGQPDACAAHPVFRTAWSPIVREATPLNRVAVYTYSFGNYHQELAAIGRKFHMEPDWDYYLFVDDEADLQSEALLRWVTEGWNVRVLGTHEAVGGLSRPRATAKFIKLKCLPPELRVYDWVVHADLTTFIPRKEGKEHMYCLPTAGMLDELVVKRPEAQLFVQKHPQRRNAFEEMNATIAWEMENATSVSRFLGD